MPNNRPTTEIGTPKRARYSFQLTYSRIIWLYFGLLETLIALRIGLKLVGANPNNLIVAPIYGFTSLFIIVGWIESPTVGSMVLELSSMFTMLIYALLALVMERIIWLIFYRSRLSGVSKPTNSEHPFSS